jgi:hypothetical protein
VIRLVPLLVLVGALLTSCAFPQTPGDVPKDHWAYEAVRTLIEKGYMLGYPDGSFLGNRPMTRYEFAVIINRIMDDMAAKAVAQVTQEAPKPVEQVTPEDMANLRKLMEEFKPELVVIGARLDKVEAALADLCNAVAGVKKDVSSLKKVNVSGYIQARYNVFQGDPNSATAGAPASNFSVRRARVKITGKPTEHSVAVYQFDGGQGYTGVTGPTVITKDAYLEYHFTNEAGRQVDWIMGQMKWPFGYELPQSSSVRESPERALITQRLFPGERDRGSYVSWPFIEDKLTWRIGAFNGVQATQAPPTDAKAMVTSLRGKLGPVDMGLSAWYGGRVMDKTGQWYYKETEPKKRIGADAEWYGKDFTVKAEYFRGQGVDGVDSTKPFQPSAVSESVDGGWAQATWNFLNDYTLAAKFETMSFDPLYPQFGRRSAWNLGALHWLDEKTRLKLYYIINNEQYHSFPNNAFIGEWITVF